MGRALKSNTPGILDAEPFEGMQDPLPYVLVGDDIFGLETWMQHPFPGHNILKNQRTFNYSLSRGRRVIESKFAILTARWESLVTQ